jgi:hypothetical protein
MMAKRRTTGEFATQLRPDDSGWLAELRRARTERIDLSGDPDARPAWADETTLHGEPGSDDAPVAPQPVAETAADPDGPDEAGQPELTGGRQSPWAPPPGTESPISPALPPIDISAPSPVSAPRPVSPMPVSPMSVTPISVSPTPVSPVPLSPAAQPRPLWTMAVPEPPQWSLPMPAQPLSPPPVLTVPAARFPQPPPPARWLPEPLPEPAVHHPVAHYQDVMPEPYEIHLYDHDPDEDTLPPKRIKGRGRRRWAILVPLLALAAGTVIGLAYRSAHRPAPPPAPPAEQPLSVGAVSITDGGSWVRLAWADPTGGEATFVISQITPEGARPVRDVPAGQTETVIVGLDRAAAQYCFRVLALRGEQTAASATTCTPTRTLVG